MATLAITNLGLRSFQHPIMGLQAADGATRTYTLKLNEIDITRGDYDNLAKFGVVIAESGTYRPGSVILTNDATLTVAQKCVILDISNVNPHTITLPALAGVAVGSPIFIYLRTNSAGAVITIDGNGAETVLGTATQTMTVAGTYLRIMKENATNWKAYSL